MRRSTALALFSVGFMLGLTYSAAGHGMNGLPNSLEQEMCACSKVLEPDGWVDPCKTGDYYAAPTRSAAATAEEKLVSIAKIRRLISRLRLELTADP